MLQWEGGTIANATWDNAKEFYKEFPKFNLRNKVALNGEGNVTWNNSNATTTHELATKLESIDSMNKMTKGELVRPQG